MKNNPWFVTATTAVLAAALASAACIIAAHLLRPLPEWKASGDGKTIFNEKTGELRYTNSGRSVAEVHAEAVRQAKEEKERWRIEAEETKRKNEEWSLAADRKRQAARRHNTQQFQKVKAFVDAHPKIEGVTFYEKWGDITKPFRTFKLLSRHEHAELLNFLGLAVQKEPYKSDPAFAKAIEDLKAYDLSYSD